MATTGRITPIPAEATPDPTAALMSAFTTDGSATTTATLEPIMFAMAMPLLVLNDNSNSSSSSSVAVVSKSRKSRKSGKGMKLSKGKKSSKLLKSKGRKDSEQSKSGKSSTGEAALLVDYFKLVRGRGEKVVRSSRAA